MGARAERRDVLCLCGRLHDVAVTTQRLASHDTKAWDGGTLGKGDVAMLVRGSGVRAEEDVGGGAEGNVRVGGQKRSLKSVRMDDLSKPIPNASGASQYQR